MNFKAVQKGNKLSQARKNQLLIVGKLWTYFYPNYLIQNNTFGALESQDSISSKVDSRCFWWKVVGNKFKVDG